jgi:FMN phosphatase YigB (HAD superfamily)
MDIIFDLDGTLADCSHRLHFIQSKPKNWKAFFDGIPHDQPIRDTLAVAWHLYHAKDFSGGYWNQIIFCTGRSEAYREATINWLSCHLSDWTRESPLYMRPLTDHRPDYVVKEELLTKMRSDGYDPRIAFEDRDQVVDMWRQNGLICYQVAKGAY